MGQAPDGDLLARLARLGVQLGTGGIARPERSGDDGTDATQRNSRSFLSHEPQAPHLAVLPLEEALPGADWPHLSSRCWVTGARRPLDDRHADELLEAGLTASTRVSLNTSRSPGFSRDARSRTRRCCGPSAARCSKREAERSANGKRAINSSGNS